MKINELFDLEKMWQELDSRMNYDTNQRRREEHDRYKEIATISKGETPVIASEPKVSKKDRYTNMPKEDESQTPGYRGGESVKKRAGVPHKKYNKSYNNGTDFNRQTHPDFTKPVGY